MNQIKIGAALNYVTILLTNVIGLIMTPFILNHLGKAEYGIYLTIGALVGTISLLDFGLNNTVVRFIAKYKAEKDRKGEENFLATTMLLYVIISLIAIVLGVVFYGYMDDYFTKMTKDELKIAKIIFSIFIFNLAIGLPGAAFTGICYGYESFVFPKTLNIIRYILRSITVLTVLFLGGKAIQLVIIDSIFNISIIIITAFFVFKKLKVKIKLHTLSKEFVKHIFSYSVWIFVFSLVGIFQWKVGHWILGRIASPEVLSVYGIGIVLGTYYGAFSSAISSVFLPRATKMAVANVSGEELTSMMIKIGRISFIILMYILIAFFLFGKQFVFLWVGSELGRDGAYTSWLIALIIMIGLTIPLIQYFGTSILEAQGRISFKAKIYLLFLIIGTVIGAFFAKQYGGIGMICGSVSGMVVAQFFLNIYYYRIVNINILRFFKEVFNKTFLLLLLVFGISYFLNYIPGNNWFIFVIRACIYSLVFILIMYNLGMIESEKKIFRDPIVVLLKKIKIINE